MTFTEFFQSVGWNVWTHLWQRMCSSKKNQDTPPTGGFLVLHPPSPQEIPVQLHTLLLKFGLLKPPSP